MPALLLILRIGKVTVPLPYFLVWLLAIPFAVIGWLVGLAGVLVKPGSWIMRVCRQAWRIPLLLMRMHGTEVRVDGPDARVMVKFI